MAVCRMATAGCETVDACRERVTRNSPYEPQRNVVRSERRRVPKGVLKGVLSRDAREGTQGTWPGARPLAGSPAKQVFGPIADVQHGSLGADLSSCPGFARRAQIGCRKTYTVRPVRCGQVADSHAHRDG